MEDKFKSEDIGGFRYEVSLLPAGEGMKLYFKILKIVLPALGSIANGGTTKDISWDAVAKVLVTSADEDVLDAMRLQMARVTDIYGPGFGEMGAPLIKHFDTHFKGRMACASAWLLFALSMQVKDFFDGDVNVKAMFASVIGKVFPSLHI